MEKHQVLWQLTLREIGKSVAVAGVLCNVAEILAFRCAMNVEMYL